MLQPLLDETNIQNQETNLLVEQAMNLHLIPYHQLIYTSLMTSYHLDNHRNKPYNTWRSKLRLECQQRLKYKKSGRNHQATSHVHAQGECCG